MKVKIKKVTVVSGSYGLVYVTVVLTNGVKETVETEVVQE